MNAPAPATLTGLAIGDSLGMPFEMSKPSHPRLKAWGGGYEDGSASPYTKELGPGQWTDDTKMAKALAESLIEEKAYSPAGAARKYLEWYRSGDLRGIGTATYQAMKKLDMNVPWTQSGTPNAEGNGTAMRVGPLGLFYRFNIQAAAEMAAIDARITHDSHEARVGSVAVALGVTALLQGAIPETVVSKVLEWLPDSEIRNRLREVERTFEYLIGSSDETVAEAIAKMGAKAHVIETVPAAFMALATTRSFKGALRAAILCGGDTDTTGAVTGALAGTYYGISQVQPFLDGLEAANELRAIEQALYDNAPQVQPNG